MVNALSMRDQAYVDYDHRRGELPHHYGDNVHLMAEPVMLTQLAELCRAETRQPEVTYLVRDLYQALVRTVLNQEMPRAVQSVRTRMFTATPNGVWHGSLLATETRVVTVGLARAGTLPSQIAFETLTRLLDPDAVRQDHLFMNRTLGPQGTVTGVSVAGSKIGGPVDKAMVLLPDPMGATGGSLVRAASIYKNLEGGAPRKIIAINLIVTPEYLALLRHEHPDVVVYAARLDRGMSDPAVMKTGLGECKNDERGLNERQYIVPGAGGLGEILNNSYV